MYAWPEDAGMVQRFKEYRRKYSLKSHFVKFCMDNVLFTGRNENAVHKTELLEKFQKTLPDDIGSISPVSIGMHLVAAGVVSSQLSKKYKNTCIYRGMHFANVRRLRRYNAEKPPNAAVTEMNQEGAVKEECEGQVKEGQDEEVNMEVDEEANEDYEEVKKARKEEVKEEDEGEVKKEREREVKKERETEVKKERETEVKKETEGEVKKTDEGGTNLNNSDSGPQKISKNEKRRKAKERRARMLRFESMNNNFSTQPLAPYHPQNFFTPTNLPQHPPLPANTPAPAWQHWSTASNHQPSYHNDSLQPPSTYAPPWQSVPAPPQVRVMGGVSESRCCLDRSLEPNWEGCNTNPHTETITITVSHYQACNSDTPAPHAQSCHADTRSHQSIPQWPSLPPQPSRPPPLLPYPPASTSQSPAHPSSSNSPSLFQLLLNSPPFSVSPYPRCPNPPTPPQPQISFPSHSSHASPSKPHVPQIFPTPQTPPAFPRPFHFSPARGGGGRGRGRGGGGGEAAAPPTPQTPPACRRSFHFFPAREGLGGGGGRGRGRGGW